MGITAYAQEQLGDVVYVELPELGAELTQFSPCGTIESVENRVRSVCSGQWGGHQNIMKNSMRVRNSSMMTPMVTGWILEVKLSNPDELNQLLSAQEYDAFVQESS